MSYKDHYENCSCTKNDGPRRKRPKAVEGEEQISPTIRKQRLQTSFVEEEPGWCICEHDWEEHDFNDQCLDDNCDCEGYREY